MTDTELPPSWVLPHGTVNTTAALADLHRRMSDLEHTFREIQSPEKRVQGTRSAVLVQRIGNRVEAKHVTVTHQRVFAAQEAIGELQKSNWVFVEPMQIGVVLDAFAGSDAN